MVNYRTRFIPQHLESELVNLYHLARVPLSGQKCGRYERIQWAVTQLHKEHPELSWMGIYKDMCGILE